jgi:hypothetical protein
MIDCMDSPARARTCIAPMYEGCATGPHPGGGRCNAVSTVDQFFGLFKVKAFTACLPCDLRGREARKRQTSNM